MTADEEEDEELLARYLDADLPRADRETAFHRLVDRYHRRVFAVCLPVLGSVTDAEDATQETFLKLARYAGSFRGEARLSTWLYRVARNVCTDHVRHDARRPATPVAEVGDLAHAPVEPDSSAGTDAAVSISGALAQLDPLSRQLLVLVAVEGLSYADAAAAADLATGTVKSRVSRARVRLADLLAGEPGAGPASSEPAAPPRPTETATTETATTETATTEGTTADERSSHP